MVKIQSRSKSFSSRPRVSEARFRDRVARMGVMKQPATTAAAMEGLLHQGICSLTARQWLDQKPGAGDQARDELLAQVYAQLEDCPSPATEWQAVRDVLNDDALLAALLGLGVASAALAGRAFDFGFHFARWIPCFSPSEQCLGEQSRRYHR